MKRKVEDKVGERVGIVPTFIFANDILFCKDLYVIDCINESWGNFNESEQADILNLMSSADFRFKRVNDAFEMEFPSDAELNALGVKDAKRRYRMLKRNGFITKRILDKYEDRIELVSTESSKYCGDFGSTIFNLLNTSMDKVPFFFIYEEDEYKLEEFIINEMNNANQFDIATFRELKEVIDDDKTSVALMVNYCSNLVTKLDGYENSTKVMNIKFINNAHNYTSLSSAGLTELMVTII